MDKQDTMIAVIFTIILVIGAINIDRLMVML
jgi:hypothetical protein